MPPRRLAVGVLLAVAAVIAGATLASRGSASKPRAVSVPPESWQGLVGAPRGDVALGQRMIVVMRAPSLAQRLQQAGGTATEQQEQRWTAEAMSAQQDVLLKLDTKGIFIKPELRFTRTLNGFSAALAPSAVPVLERMPQVAGVYRVRTAYPASVTTTPTAAAARSQRAQPLRSALVGLDGSGVLVALLDTGVDASVPYLRSHVLNGIDVAGAAINARPQAGPDGTPESHGTEMAGIVLGSGRSGLSGVAPGATLLPIRVGGWQRDDAGRLGLFARTDQILAGLERAVDPDRNGDAHDAARIALVPLAEPFGAFEDGPLATAAAGAAALNTLVVTPAGNDGVAGPAFGSLSGPGGAPSALTVGAADLRSRTLSARLVVRDGLDVLLNRDVPVLGSSGLVEASTARLVFPKGLFTRSGLSLAAGRAVLVPAGPDPNRAAGDAARAGAAFVLLAGDRLPAGALEGGDALAVPVLGVPSSLLRERPLGDAAGRLRRANARHAYRGGSARGRLLVLGSRIRRTSQAGSGRAGSRRRHRRSRPCARRLVPLRRRRRRQRGRGRGRGAGGDRGPGAAGAGCGRAQEPSRRHRSRPARPTRVCAGQRARRHRRGRRRRDRRPARHARVRTRVRARLDCDAAR